MFAGLAGYLVIGLVLSSIRQPGAAASSAHLVRTFYLLSILLIVAAFLVKRQMVRPLRLGSSSEEIRRWLISFRTGHLVSYVLCEGIGLLGLLALFLGGSRTQFVNLVIVALALMVLLRPKRMDASLS